MLEFFKVDSRFSILISNTIILLWYYCYYINDFSSFFIKLTNKYYVDVIAIGKNKDKILYEYQFFIKSLHHQASISYIFPKSIIVIVSSGISLIYSLLLENIWRVCKLLRSVRLQSNLIMCHEQDGGDINMFYEVKIWRHWPSDKYTINSVNQWSNFKQIDTVKRLRIV